MPPDPDAVRGGSAHTAKTQRAKAVASFAAGVVENLREALDRPAKAEKLVDELQKYGKLIEKHPRIHVLLGNKDLDTQGIKLWNLCTSDRQPNAQEGGESSAERKALILRARVFAFQILDLSGYASDSNYAQVLRLLDLALRTGVSCLREDNVELARVVLQRAADYNDHLQNLSQSQPLKQDEANECKQLKAEWLILRLTLAWKEDQLDVAEHMFSQAQAFSTSLDPSTAEKLVDTVFEVGRDLIRKRDFPMAIKWVRRAYDMLNDQQLEKMSRAAVELRLTIAQALVTSLLGVGSTDAYDEAKNLVHYLESEIGDKQVVQLLNVEVLLKAPDEVVDVDAYATTLERMTRNFNFQESNFRLLTYHIRNLHDKSPSLGTRVLDGFLLALNGQQCNAAWTEHLVINRMRMAIAYKDSDSNVDDIGKLLEKLDKPLSVEGTIAAQTLLWKNVESSFAQHQITTAEKWCRLALSPVFRNSGPHNIAILQRKLLLCADEKGDFDTARSVFYTMSEDVQNQLMTRYLMYKFAVQHSDRKLASECLEVITKASSSNSCLYACVLLSHKSGDNFIILEAMEKLKEKNEHPYAASLIHLPALLRCMIRISYSLLESESEGVDQIGIVQKICDIFQTVITAVRQDPKDASGKKLFTVDELDWFCQNAYNLGLKHAGTWNPRHVVAILNSCRHIISEFPEDVGGRGDLSLKSIFCNFVIASMLVALARAEDNIEQQLQDYLHMREHISAFDKDLQEQPVLDEVSKKDLLNKLSTLLVFDFEGAICLKKWEDLEQIVRKAHDCRCLETFQAMGESLLRERPPVDVLYPTMRLIINEVSTLPGFDNVKLARYSRCLFQAVLPSNNILALHFMDHICIMARDGAKNNVEWPSEELRWMSITAFNHGLDLSMAKQTDDCRVWVEKAMDLAQYCSDDGNLVGHLREQYLKMRVELNDYIMS